MKWGDGIRLIDANTLRAEFTGNFQELWHYTGIWAMIDTAPTIEAVPVVHGEMIGAGRISARCSVCNYLTLEIESNFCPNCGADMRKKV